jgi:hypothetical protein
VLFVGQLGHPEVDSLLPGGRTYYFKARMVSHQQTELEAMVIIGFEVQLYPAPTIAYK